MSINTRLWKDVKEVDTEYFMATWRVSSIDRVHGQATPLGDNERLGSGSKAPGVRSQNEQPLRRWRADRIPDSLNRNKA